MHELQPAIAPTPQHVRDELRRAERLASAGCLAESRAAFRAAVDADPGFAARNEKGAVWGHNNNVYLSKIFSWFKKDFEKNGGSVIQFVQPYLSKESQKFIDKYRKDLSIKYLDYDWSLNGT